MIYISLFRNMDWVPQNELNYSEIGLRLPTFTRFCSKKWFSRYRLVLRKCTESPQYVASTWVTSKVPMRAFLTPGTQTETLSVDERHFVGYQWITRKLHKTTPKWCRYVPNQKCNCIFLISPDVQLSFVLCCMK